MKKKSFIVYTSLGNVFEVWAIDEQEAKSFAYNMIDDLDEEVEDIEELFS